MEGRQQILRFAVGDTINLVDELKNHYKINVTINNFSELGSGVSTVGELLNWIKVKECLG